MLWTLNRRKYHVHIIFICTEKPKNSYDRFITVLWNHTRRISKGIFDNVKVLPKIYLGKQQQKPRWLKITLVLWEKIAQLVKNPPAMQETRFNSWVGKFPWRKERLPTPVFWPREFHGRVARVSKSQTQLSNFHFTGENLEQLLPYTFVQCY